MFFSWAYRFFFTEHVNDGAKKTSWVVSKKDKEVMLLCYNMQ